MDVCGKKIMYLLDYPIDLLGGAQISTKTLCDVLSEDNYSIIVVCPHLINGKNINCNYRIISYEQFKKFNIINLLELIKILYKIIDSEKPDIIHAQMPFSGLAAGILKKLFRKYNFYLIFTDRGLYSGYSIYSKILLTNLYSNADNFICTTNYNKILWKNKLNTCIDVIYNSISSEFEKALNKKIEIKNKKTSILKIGFAGRVASEKNWPLSIEICKLLKQREICFEVYFAFGIYSKADREKVNVYISMLNKLLNNKYINVFYNLSQNEMPLFYSNLDIFILTSSFESFGKTAIEAMACKCSVIGTKVGGLPEILMKKNNLYSENNLNKCINYIIKLYKNPSLLQDDKNYYYDRYLNNFSIQCNINKHKFLYEKYY